MIAETADEESLLRLEQIGCSERLPTSNEEAEKAEELLAEEMSKLSMSEQDVASFEIHGIAAEVQESPEVIASSLVKLESELQKIKKKQSYEKALKMNPNYVTSQRFRLQFLRCEGFNCKDAAGRLVLHFRQKEELFGPGEVLGRDVRLSDMTQKDRDNISKGIVQLLPTPDVAGRAVLCFFFGLWDEIEEVKSAQRVIYYMQQAAMMDEKVQKKGLVGLMFFVGKTIGVRFDVVKKVYQTRLAVPHRLDALHICYGSKKLRPVVSGLRVFLDKRGRTRSRVHVGDEQHVLFQLQTYGIPIPEDSPLRRVNGEFQLTWHHNFLQLKQAQERELAVAETDLETTKILLPHRFDVLFGRGNKVRCHTGNLRALHLVNLWKTRYDGAANRSKKAEISERIVSIVHESGGRFLKWEDNGWVEVEDEMARDKIAHYFRNARRQKVGEKVDERNDSPASKRSHSLLVGY